MTNDSTIPAKATTADDQSDGIVVSFGSEWHQLLLAKAFRVVIRKRIPKRRSFSWLYFHINSPISAICGRAKIEKLVSITESEAVAIAKQIHLQPAEIKAYLGGGSHIGCYRLGDFEFGSGPVSAAQVRERLVYHPPQSFFILSKDAKLVVDHLLGFSSTKDSKSSRASKS
jgi:predicted transcriptional regulator